MKLTTKTRCSGELEIKCRVCGKSYYVDYREVSSMPLWRFESCSIECAKEYSESKLLTLR